MADRDRKDDSLGGPQMDGRIAGERAGAAAGAGFTESVDAKYDAVRRFADYVDYRIQHPEDKLGLTPEQELSIDPSVTFVRTADGKIDISNEKNLQTLSAIANREHQLNQVDLTAGKVANGVFNPLTGIGAWGALIEATKRAEDPSYDPVGDLQERQRQLDRTLDDIRHVQGTQQNAGRVIAQVSPSGPIAVPQGPDSKITVRDKANPVPVEPSPVGGELDVVEGGAINSSADPTRAFAQASTAPATSTSPEVSSDAKKQADLDQQKPQTPQPASPTR